MNKKVIWIEKVISAKRNPNGFREVTSSEEVVSSIQEADSDNKIKMSKKYE